MGLSFPLEALNASNHLSSADCGLFLLEFAEHYLAGASLFDIAAYRDDFVDRANWFSPLDLSSKRLSSYKLLLHPKFKRQISAPHKTVVRLAY